MDVTSITPEMFPKAPTAPKGINKDEVIALRKKGLSYDQIAKLMDCTRSTIWFHAHEYEKEVEDAVIFKENEKDILNIVRMRLLSTLSLDEIKTMSPSQRMVAYGIAFDKYRLEIGQATQIVDSFRVAIQRVETKLVTDKGTCSINNVSSNEQSNDIIELQATESSHNKALSAPIEEIPDKVAVSALDPMPDIPKPKRPYHKSQARLKAEKVGGGRRGRPPKAK